MGNHVELLEAQALQLTSVERAAFAQLLRVSLDEDTDKAWASAIECRISDVGNGTLQVIPSAYALAEVRASLT